MAHDSETAKRGVNLLVDGENLSADFADELVAIARTFGELLVARVYGKVPGVGGWVSAPDFQAIHTGTAKNSADILLSLEAADLSAAGNARAFVIATSDGDFTHLARYLRARGFCVVGVGEQKAPDYFRRACSQFHKLEPRPGSGKEKFDELDKQILELIKRHGDGQALRIADINGLMRRTNDFRISNHEKKTWRSYLTSKPDMYDCDKKGPEARVRLKS